MKTTLLAMFLSGCVTETGNPELDVDVDLSVLARSTDPGLVSIAAGPSTVVTGAWITFDEVSFVRADDCDDDGVEVEIEGPWTVDLVAADTIPVQLAGTQYCRLRIRVERAEGGDLDDLSVVVRGTRADGVPFAIASRDTPTLELRSESAPFTVTGDALLLAFDLARWLEDVGVEQLAPVDGEVLIDEGGHAEALGDFEDAVERSLELFSDQDGDGQVDPGSEPLAAG